MIDSLGTFVDQLLVHLHRYHHYSNLHHHFPNKKFFIIKTKKILWILLLYPNINPLLFLILILHLLFVQENILETYHYLWFVLGIDNKYNSMECYSIGKKINMKNKTKKNFITSNWSRNQRTACFQRRFISWSVCNKSRAFEQLNKIFLKN